MNKSFKKGLESCSEAKYAEAIFHFTKALESEENPQIYYERAIAHHHIKDNKSALKDLDAALELEPENPYRYSSRAYIKNIMGDTGGAINDYKKAIELDPEDAIAYNNLGLLEEKLGFEENSKQHFIIAETLAKKTELFNIPANGKNGSESPVGFLHNFKNEKPEKRNVAGNYFKEIFYVFSKKSAWLEFLKFIKNGGKLE